MSDVKAPGGGKAKGAPTRKPKRVGISVLKLMTEDAKKKPKAVPEVLFLGKPIPLKAGFPDKTGKLVQPPGEYKWTVTGPATRRNDEPSTTLDPVSAGTGTIRCTFTPSSPSGAPPSSSWFAAADRVFRRAFFPSCRSPKPCWR